MNDQEEDEKTSEPLSTYDVRVYDAFRKVLEQKSEELMKVFSNEFIDYLLTSNALPGVNINFYHPISWQLIMILDYELEISRTRHFHILGIP